MTPHTPKALSEQPGWLQVSITTAAELSETIASGLATITDRGIETKAWADSSMETIIAYLPDDLEGHKLLDEITAFLARTQGIFTDFPSPSIVIDKIPEEDWNARWKVHFHPKKLTKRLVIKPSWEEYTATDDEIVIEIDPGQAFGTGHHESTRLALFLIEELFERHPAPVSVLDVGTGTGILAIASAKFGAGNGLAIDNDPLAVEAAQDNIRICGVAQTVTASDQALDTITASFDLVIANIIHDTLIDMAPALTARLAPGGRLILAGILAGNQERNIVRRYREMGLSHCSTRIDGEWAAFLFAQPQQG